MSSTVAPVWAAAVSVWQQVDAMLLMICPKSSSWCAKTMWCWARISVIADSWLVVNWSPSRARGRSGRTSTVALPAKAAKGVLLGLHCGTEWVS
uniref:Putative secreted protein n=1 Tax=Ixodes ricinus TaxID=34613 RepID=A0A147BRE3_IXORI